MISRLAGNGQTVGSRKLPDIRPEHSYDQSACGKLPAIRPGRLSGPTSLQKPIGKPGYTFIQWHLGFKPKHCF